MMIPQASLYFHIPFCTKKCPYCHFYVVPNQLRFHEILKEGLALEWIRQQPLLDGKQIISLYFGGGTPSLFGAVAIGEIIKRCTHLADDCEITVEVNPEEASEQLFSDLKQVGVNRISLGVQSLDDRSLMTLERQHTATKALEALRNAEKAGIRNLSIDLMYDLPDQTEASWRYTLDQLADLPIHHLSLYNLTIEPHTSFHKRKNLLSFPTPEQSLRFLHLALESLEKIGLVRYEISAFAKPGFASRHNLGYWTFRPFLGFGPSAFSYWEKERFRNIPHLQRYTRALKQGESPIDFREKLSYPASLREELAVRLRVLSGCPLPPSLPPDTAKALDSLIEQKLIVQTGQNIRLTERGLLFYDTVASELI